jgi:NADH-quinone oxidoreductase subunit C
VSTAEVLHPSRDEYLDTVKRLADDGYTMCVDVTAVDYLAHPGRTLPDGVSPERFEIVAVFIDLATARRVRLRVQVPDADPTIPTLFDIHPGTEALEREVFDMYGIVFTDHPDLTRIPCPRTGKATRCARTTRWARSPSSSRMPPRE